MNIKFDCALADFMAACRNLILDPSLETVATYATSWRGVRAASRAAFGESIAFRMLRGLIEERYGRDGLTAANAAMLLIDRLGGHAAFVAKASSTAGGSSRRTSPDGDTDSRPDWHRAVRDRRCRGRPHSTR